ncbi:MAG: leucine-rich repeat domain-containing protein [Verrucomicrobia bacterium]|nr:leucine-rich repeat domain-containing protein [Verrucomicrobiota bacterium]
MGSKINFKQDCNSLYPIPHNPDDVPDASQEGRIVSSQPPQALSLIFSFISGNNRPDDLMNLRTVREVCTLWNQVAELAILKPYWHMVKELPCFKLPQFAQVFEQIETTNPAIGQSFIIKFQELSAKLLPSPATLVLPRDYQGLFDSSLKKMWSKLCPMLGFQVDDPISKDAIEIRAWLNDPANAHRLSQVYALDLSHLELEFLPPEIGLFTQLKTLCLRYNSLSSITPQIGNLVQLTHLNVEHNHLKELPSEIGNLFRLNYLNASHNRLQSLPPEMGNLVQLVQLYLEHNELESLPPEIIKLTRLFQFCLFGNNLRNLPSEILSLVTPDPFSIESNNNLKT